MYTVDAQNFGFYFCYRTFSFLKAKTHAFIRPCGTNGWHHVVINAQNFHIFIIKHLPIAGVYQCTGQQAPHAMRDDDDFVTFESAFLVAFDQAAQSLCNSDGGYPIALDKVVAHRMHRVPTRRNFL
ncbi:hypothetical protein D3C72_1879590 [compost metagenome]